MIGTMHGSNSSQECMPSFAWPFIYLVLSHFMFGSLVLLWPWFQLDCNGPGTLGLPSIQDTVAGDFDHGCAVLALEQPGKILA